MPITVTNTGTAGSTFNAFNTVSSGTVSVAAGDLITVTVVFTDANPAGNLSIANTNEAITWSLIQDTASTGCRVASWWGRAGGAGNRQFQVSWDSTNGLPWAMFWAQHQGADAGATPIGSSNKGVGANSVSYTITPAGSGSALWLVAADAAGAGVQTMTAGTNCSLIREQGTIDQFAAAMFAPTTNPRTDGSAFTLAETHAGSGVNWVGFEVKAEGTAQTQSPRSMHQYRQRFAA